jgi:hypothetical protein
MSRKLSLIFIQKSSAALCFALLICAALSPLTGCTTISGKQIRAENSPEIKTAAALAGKWQQTPADYAVYAENLGSFESLEITADGRVRYENLIIAKNYDCRTETVAASEGTVTVTSDSALRITLDAGTVRQTGGCSADKNTTAATAPASTDYRFRLGTDAGGATELILTKTNGETVRFRRAA